MLNGKSIWYRPLFAESGKPRAAVVVDFDGTIAEDAYPQIGAPMPGVRDAFRRLMDAGFEIVVFSCRTNPQGNPEGHAAREKEKMERWLADNDIPYTRIDMGTEGKPHGVAMVDNKAVSYSGGEDEWEAIADSILDKGHV